ncbi:MAG: Membrane-fusion protein-like protein [Bryobacterales bacterium]|nr:Membrane-fusion protein-like protein [Bryobacterales bacterium]
MSPKVPAARRWLKYFVRLTVLAVIVAGSVYGVREFRKNKQAADLPVATARKGEFLVLVRSRGQLMARRSQQISAPIDVPDLQIIWQAPAGSAVRTNDPVIRFDPGRTQQDLKEKQASLAQAQSALDQAVAQSRITEDQDNLDLSTSKYAHERAKLEASKQAIVSRIQGEESEIDLGLAEGKLRVQQAAMTTHKRSAESKLSSLERARDNAKGQVELVEYHLTQMELRSPLDGVINYMPNYSQGWMNAQPFRVGDRAGAGQIIAEIPDLGTLEMECKVEEIDRGRITVGATVLVHVDAFPETTLPAKIDSITPLTEQSFNEWPPTRSFRAYAHLEKPDPRMRPGMNSAADLVERRIPDAIHIPAKALFTIAGKPAVYIKANGKYTPTPVTVVARNPDEVAVDGLPAGTLVTLAEPPQEKKQ